jgi:hypothetical protein
MSAQYLTLQKYFFTSLVIYFLPTSPIKTKTGTANRWETTNSKALGQIIMIGQSETLQIGGRLLIAKHLDKSL